MADSRRSLALVTNETAEDSPELADALAPLREQGYALDLVPVADAPRALQNAPDIIVAAGGDGTLNRVVSMLIHHDRTTLPVGLLPFGTGNDFATACGIDTDDISTAFVQLLESEPSPVDVWTLDGRHFVNVTSGGFGAEITSETPPAMKQFLGRFAYSVKGLLKTFESKDRRAAIEGDGQSWDGTLLFLALANGQSAGGGYRVGPRARLDDGLLDVLVVPDVGILELPSLISEVLDAGNVDNEQVVYFQTPWLEVTTPNGLYLTLDGEPHQAQKFRVERHPARVPLLLPASAPCGRSASG